MLQSNSKPRAVILVQVSNTTRIQTLMMFAFHTTKTSALLLSVGSEHSLYTPSSQDAFQYEGTVTEFSSLLPELCERFQILLSSVGSRKFQGAQNYNYKHNS